MESSADFSACDRYRYALWRSWDASGPLLNIIGLNPSTADAIHNDNTIRRCIGFAQDNDFGRLCVTNLFAYRATYPSDLRAYHQPIGPENDAWLKRVATQADTLLFAWGNDGLVNGRADQVLGFLPEGSCLGITKKGAPRHPLYVRKDAVWLPYPL